MALPYIKYSAIGPCANCSKRGGMNSENSILVALISAVERVTSMISSDFRSYFKHYCDLFPISSGIPGLLQGSSCVLVPPARYLKCNVRFGVSYTIISQILF